MKTSKNIHEGPHISYSSKSVIASTLLIDEKDFLMTEKRIESSDLNNYEFEVKMPELGQKFSFELIAEHTIPRIKYPESEKILIISDVEGDFIYIRDILKSNGIIDDNFNWIFGTGRLVVLGDTFDRGNLVTECLWLIYKLEKQAAVAGGQVHFIIGNHEAMALSGDDRYINKKYRKISSELKKEYMDFFNPSTVLGSWLRTKNSIEIIGKTLFVHGGVSPTLINSDLSTEDVNNIVRQRIDKETSRHANLTPTEKLVMGHNGPLWYRAYVENNIDSLDIQKILKHYDVDQIVVGHTMVKDVTSLYNDSVYAIDVNRKKRDIQVALLKENNKFYRVNTLGTKTAL